MPTEAEWAAIMAEDVPDRPGIDLAAEDAKWANAGAFTGNTTPAQARAVLRSRRVGERGPQKAPTKEKATLRYPSGALDRWRATGKGWQGRLGAWVAQGPAEATQQL